MEYKVNVGTPANVQHLKLFVAVFEYASTSKEWYGWYKEYRNVLEMVGVQDNTAAQYRNLRALPREPAKRYFANEVTARSVEHKEKLAAALDALAITHNLPKTARKDLVDKITNSLKKHDVSVSQYAREIHEVNSLIKYLPKDENKQLELGKIVQYFRAGMP